MANERVKELIAEGWDLMHAVYAAQLERQLAEAKQGEGLSDLAARQAREQLQQAERRIAELEGETLSLRSERDLALGRAEGLEEQGRRNLAELTEAQSLLREARDVLGFDERLLETAHAQLAEAREEIGQLQEWAAYWLLRARKAWEREDWEEGPSTEETRDSIVSVLFNLGCDDGADPKQRAEAIRILALPPSHTPPGTRDGGSSPVQAAGGATGGSR